MQTYGERIKIPSLEGIFEKKLVSSMFSNQRNKDNYKNRYNLQFLCFAWTSLLADSPISLKPNSVIHNFISKYMSDPTSLIKNYSDLAHRLTKSVTYDDDKNIIVVFIDDMKNTPVFKEYHQFVKTKDASIFRYILSFLTFGKKAYYDSEDFERNAFRAWLEVEDRLASIELPQSVDNLRTIVHWIFKDWSFDTFLPKHGGGAVAEIGVLGVNAKNLNFTSNPAIDYLYLRKNNLFQYLESDLSCLPLDEANRPKSRVSSRLHFVPKDCKTARSICMEPVVVQWAQQGVRLEYERYLKTSVLKRHVCLSDQGMNQRYAQYGSETTLLDTLDLSSASDSVAWELVKAIFPAKVLKHLAATRTSIVELPDGREFPVRKFSPMGSSLCFPVQTTIYSAIILMVSMARNLGRDWRQSGCFHDVDLDKLYAITYSSQFQKTRRLHPFTAYGDDLILDQRISSSVVELLQSLGFVVNVSKSFFKNDAYRESCGKHYLFGIDVTPIYCKTKKLSKSVSIESMVSLVEMANRSFDYGYLCLRRTIINYCLYRPIKGLKAVGRNPILFSNNIDDSFSILSEHPVNKHLKLRKFCFSKVLDVDSTSQRYQRSEVLRISLGPLRKPKLLKKFDNYRYTLWWNSRYNGVGTDNLLSVPVKTDALGVGIRWEWFPV
jgi:hypothetical protein